MANHIVILRSGKTVVMPPGLVETRIMQALGTVVEKRRASHIWPGDWIHRVAFRAIRLVFRDESPIVEWAKRWMVVWTVSWADKPGVVVFTSKSRRECRRWEREQLFNRVRRGQV